ncbi:MAG: hypothetical protein KIS96_11795 [Bauldia sp.]|nr:hypothetical protein [Bauldia sp.]
MQPWMYAVVIYLLGAFLTMVACHILSRRQYLDTPDVFTIAVLWPFIWIAAVIAGVMVLPFLAMNWLAKRIARRFV